MNAIYLLLLPSIPVDGSDFDRSLHTDGVVHAISTFPLALFSPYVALIGHFICSSSCTETLDIIASGTSNNRLKWDVMMGNILTHSLSALRRKFQWLREHSNK